MEREMSSLNEANSSACSLHAACSSPPPLMRLKYHVMLQSARPLQRTFATSRWPLHLLDSVLQGSSTLLPMLHHERVRPKTACRRGCLCKHICPWREGHKPRCRWSTALLLRMRLKCSPRHLSSACTFKSHASGKSRNSFRDAKSTTGTSAPHKGLCETSPTARWCTPPHSRAKCPSWLVLATQPLTNSLPFPRTLQSRRTVPVPGPPLENQMR